MSRYQYRGPARSGQPGYVYIVAGGGLHKIGWSRDYKARLAELKSASPVPLELVALYRGTLETETHVHRLFRRYRRHGEWFALPKWWRGAIERRLTVPADEVEVAA